MPQLTQLENWVKSRNLGAVSEQSSPGERYKWQEGGCLLLQAYELCEVFGWLEVPTGVNSWCPGASREWWQKLMAVHLREKTCLGFISGHARATFIWESVDSCGQGLVADCSTHMGYFLKSPSLRHPWFCWNVGKAMKWIKNILGGTQQTWILCDFLVNAK